MPSLKNISERKFVIAGKELNKGESLPFAQSVIDAHVSAYPNELVQVEGGEKEVESPKEEQKPVVSQKEPEIEDKLEYAQSNEEAEIIDGDSLPVVEVKLEDFKPEEHAEEITAVPAKRGRKPKAKE